MYVLKAIANHAFALMDQVPGKVSAIIDQMPEIIEQIPGKVSAMIDQIPEQISEINVQINGGFPEQVMVIAIAMDVAFFAEAFFAGAGFVYTAGTAFLGVGLLFGIYYILRYRLAASFEESAQRLEIEVQNLNGQLNVMRGENAQFMANNDRLQGEVNRFQGQVGVLEGQVNRIGSENAQFAASNQALTQTTRELEVNKDKLRKEIETLRLNSTAAISQLQRENLQLTTTRKDLQGEVELLGSKIKDLDLAKDELFEQLDKSTQAFERLLNHNEFKTLAVRQGDLTNRLEKLNEQLYNTLNEKAFAQRMTLVETTTTKFEEARTQHAVLLEKTAFLQNQLETITRELAEKQAASAALHEQYVATHRNYDQTHHRLNRSVSDLNLLSARFHARTLSEGEIPANNLHMRTFIIGDTGHGTNSGAEGPPPYPGNGDKLPVS